MLSLPDDGWIVGGTCCHHCACSACLAVVWWDSALWVRSCLCCAPLWLPFLSGAALLFLILNNFWLRLLAALTSQLGFSLFLQIQSPSIKGEHGESSS